MKVREIMNSPVVTANEDDSLEQCARKMLKLKIDELPVVNDDGELTGFLSVTDFVAKKTTVSFSRTEILELFRTVVRQGRNRKDIQGRRAHHREGSNEQPRHIYRTGRIDKRGVRETGRSRHPQRRRGRGRKTRGTCLGIRFPETDRKINYLRSHSAIMKSFGVSKEKQRRLRRR